MKKNSIFLALGLATAAFQGPIMGAEVSTDPVGVVTVTAKNQSDLTLGLPLQRNFAFQVPLSAVNGNVLSVQATLTANQLVYSSGTQSNNYFIRVISTVSPTSSVAGTWYSVVSNTASSGTPGVGSITVDAGGGQTVAQLGLAVGDVIQIVPFWTLNTLFPDGKGITPTSNIDNPRDTVGFLPQDRAGVNFPITQSNFYNTSPDLPVGWYNLGLFTPTGDQPIPPDTYMVVRNKGAQKPISITGRVPMSAQSTVVGLVAEGVPQDNLVSNPYPVPISLSQTKLFESGIFKPTPNIDSPQDLLLAYNGSESGANSRPSQTYFYSTDPQLGTGWYKLGTFDGPLDNNKLLMPGCGLIIRKRAGTLQSFVWTIPTPY